MRELNTGEITAVSGGVWTPTTTIHDSPTDSTETERFKQLLFWLATQS